MDNQGNRPKLKSEFRIGINEDQRIILPPEMISRYGLRPGMELFIDEVEYGFHLRLPVNHLGKVYIEPTNRCNLECRTCIRNGWDEPLGFMGRKIFSRLIEGLRDFSPAPSVFFGGFGEPLAHPDIVDMVAQTKALSKQVELITNGTLLNREMSRQLIEVGLDMLWVSLDGAKPESYADVRLGAALPQVIANLMTFRESRHLAFPHKSQLGVVFVAMKRNIHDLPAVLRLGSQLGAQRFLVTNILPYTSEMRNEILYSRVLGDFVYGPSLELPKLDMNDITREPFYWTLRSGMNLAIGGVRWAEANDRCPFIERGATAISWEGKVSPCLPLLHSHTSFLEERERISKRYEVGSLSDSHLSALWNEPEYVALRNRLKNFDFSPCYICGGCELAEKNEEDCFGNIFPTCGGCLWAQGIIQCP